MVEATGLGGPVHLVAGITAARAAQLEKRSVLAEREGMRAALPVTLGRSWPQGMFDPASYQRYRARYLASDPACFAAHNRVLATSDVINEYERTPQAERSPTSPPARPPATS